MDYLYQSQEQSDAQRLETRQRVFELEVATIIQKAQADIMRSARLNLAATFFFGSIIIILSIVQLRFMNNPPTQERRPPGLELMFPTGDTDPKR